jgi:hypothetical protein
MSRRQRWRSRAPGLRAGLVAALVAAACGDPTGPTRVAERNLIRVPGDAPSIQQGVDAAKDGDVVLVAPGTYHETVAIQGKAITLASRYLESHDSQHIEKTVLDGAGDPVVSVTEGGDGRIRIIGFTIQNGEHGIDTRESRVEIRDNRILGHRREGIGLLSSDAVIRDNTIRGNGDDGIDCDGATGAVIEGNVIDKNGDDGIEVRLHAYTGPQLTVAIRNNHISRSEEDGVQLIDYPGRSDRVFRIERNVFRAIGRAAVGSMADGATRENYQGAPLEEPVFVIHNTFVKNHYGLIGGDNLLALNNVFKRTEKVAMKRLRGDSIAAYNLFWKNGKDLDDAVSEPENTLFTNPRLDDNHHLESGSPAIDAGTASYQRDGRDLFEVAQDAYAGRAPDLGAFERE